MNLLANQRNGMKTNMMQTFDILQGAGFAITDSRRSKVEAVRRDLNNPEQGIRLTGYFGEREAEGKMLKSIHLYVFPALDTDCSVLNGVVKRNFEAGKEIASYFECPVSAITCKPIAQFND